MFRVILLLAFTSTLSALNFTEGIGSHVDGEKLLRVDKFQTPVMGVLEEKANLTFDVFYDGRNSIHNLTYIEFIVNTDSKSIIGSGLIGGPGETFINETKTAYDATYFMLEGKYYGFKLE